MNAPNALDFLPLSENLDTLVSALREGRSVDWATPQLLGRAATLRLVDRDGAAPVLTELGVTVAAVTGEHWLETWRKPLGRGRIAGSGMQYGLKAACACREWKWTTNEKPSRSRGTARARHAEHLAALIAAAN